MRLGPDANDSPAGAHGLLRQAGLYGFGKTRPADGCPLAAGRVDSAMDAEERFAALVREFADSPGVSGPDPSGSRKFGAATLKVNGSIFAMVVGGRVVLKLPRERVASLIDDGTGAPFESGRGQPMKEWTAVAVDDDGTTVALAREALGFVRSRPRSR